jgi:hypothetical protein
MPLDAIVASSIFTTHCQDYITILIFLLVVILLLKCFLLPWFVKQPSLKWLVRIKVALLSSGSLLVLKHFFVYVCDNSHFVDVKLHFVFVVLKASKHRYAVANLYILLIQPWPKVALSVASLSVVEFIEPENAGHHTSRIIDAKKVLVVFLNVEHDGSRDGHFSQQPLISQNKEDFARLLILLPEHVMVHNG